MHGYDAERTCFAVDPYHLRTFLAVRKHLNYTRAAEELLLSQPAVSRQIHQLEQALAVTLFERIGRSVHLTDAGRTLALEAERILGDLERAGEAVRAHGSPGRGRLRIGASTTPGFYLLPEPLGRFHRKFPSVEIAYTVQNSLAIEQMILRNELDLGFVGAHLSGRGLLLEQVLQDEVVCFAGASHSLAREERIDPRSLQRQTCVIREKGSATRSLFEAWLSGVGAEIGPTIELRCPEAVKAVVAGGLGFSFISVHGLAEGTGRKRFRRLPVEGLRLRRPIYLARHVDKRVSPDMGAFLEMVRGSFAARTGGTAGKTPSDPVRRLTGRERP